MDRRMYFALGAVFGALVAGGTVAVARVGTEPGTIAACVDKDSGLMRKLNRKAEEECTDGERRVTWNKRGPQGEPGDQGPQGNPGASGTPGADGEPGAGFIVIDANRRKIGEVLYAGFNEVIFSTGTDYRVLELATGAWSPRHTLIGYTSPGCNGQAYIDDEQPLGIYAATGLAEGAVTVDGTRSVRRTGESAELQMVSYTDRGICLPVPEYYGPADYVPIEFGPLLPSAPGPLTMRRIGS